MCIRDRHPIGRRHLFSVNDPDRPNSRRPGGSGTNLHSIVPASIRPKPRLTGHISFHAADGRSRGSHNHPVCRQLSGRITRGGKYRKPVSYTHILVSNMLGKPLYWEGTISWDFGEYSRKKHELCILELGRDFPAEASEYSAESRMWDVYGAYMSNYFEENYPVYDENDRIIEPW